MRITKQIYTRILFTFVQGCWSFLVHFSACWNLLNFIIIFCKFKYGYIYVSYSNKLNGICIDGQEEYQYTYAHTLSLSEGEPGEKQ